MTADGAPDAGRREDELFDRAPCGYVITTPDGRILRANRAFAEQVQLTQAELEDGRRLRDLLTAGAQLYLETHVTPRLLVTGSMSEAAIELQRADGSRLPALISANLARDEHGRPESIRMVVFEASERRRYEQGLLRAQRDDHAVAHELQHSLLSGALPQADSFDLAIVYRAAEGRLAIGGDWYDAFWLDAQQTRIGLVVGDVVGRGLQAATTMGQLRSAVRAFALGGRAPAELLISLDRYARRYEVGQITTLVYADLELASGTMRFACAGHPPPLLTAPGQAAQLLWEGRSEPLAAFAEPSGSRAEASVSLGVGAVMLFYSDGLTERDADRSTDGLGALPDDVDKLGMVDPARLVGALGDLQRGAAFRDDLCLLAIRLN